jgi:predicted ATPase
VFDHIKIEGFRSFKQIELDLAPLSVLIGPNNGGKSNFLDLMSLMAEAGQGRLKRGIDARGGYFGVAFGPDGFDDILIEFRFPKFSSRSLLSLLPGFPGKERSNVRFKVGLLISDIFRAGDIRDEEVTEELISPSARQVSLVKRDASGCVFRSIDGVGDEVEERKVLESDSELAIFQVKDLFKYPTPYNLLKDLQEWTVYRDIDVRSEAPVRLPALLRPTLRLSENGANLSSVLHSIQQGHPDVWEEILELLHTACPEFRDIRIPGEGGDGKVLLRWYEPPYEKEGVSPNLLSEGTLKFLCLVAILKSPDPPPLICIDEPEIGLHPDWIKLVAEMMQSAAARTQLIIATHSPQIVARLDPEQVIITEKENGETRLRQLQRQDLEKWLKEFNLSDLWLAGHFGGRP